MHYLEMLLHGAVDTVFVLLILLLAKWFRDYRYGAALAIPQGADPKEYNANFQIEEKSNLAAALRCCGVSIGFGLGLAGVVHGGVTSFEAGWGAVLENSTTLLFNCLLVLVFLFIAEVIVEKIILRSVHNTTELQRGNIAVGLAEFGSFIATGLIAFGAFSGDGGGWQSAVGFFLAGQLALILFALIYEVATPFNIIAEIEKGNAAAGLILGGTLVALGVILSFAVSGPFVGWAPGLIAFAACTVIGVVLLIPSQALIDKAFLPNTTLKIEIERDRNVAATAVTVCAQVALAIMIGALVGGS